MSTSSKTSIQDLLNQDLGNSVNISQFGKTFFQSVDTPVSLGAYLRLKHKEYAQLVSMRVSPFDYNDSNDYFIDNQVISLLRKFEGFDTGINLYQVTFDKFIKCEADCSIHNNAMSAWSGGRLRFSPDIESVFQSAQWKIHRLLGKLDIEEWLGSCHFGPGNASSIPGTSDYVKLSADPSCTEQLEPFALELLSEYQGWVTSLTYDGASPFSYEVIPGGSYSQVPKDATTNRNIEVQPLLNGVCQLGLGDMIRRRLKRVGIDLDNQEDNQMLAKVGSVMDNYATIDLSNASDTIGRGLVEYLLPGDWLHAMNVARTHSILVDGTYRPLHRFCSMGNGFAFELESLIFWAISKSACEVTKPNPHILVYGDDIIVPVECVSQVYRSLSAAGFTVNARKSYVHGIFRESCGADWWSGRNVRPFFLKERPTNVAALISMANGLKRAAGRCNRDFGYDRRFAAAWFLILRWIPVQVRRRLAFGYTESDDIVLHTRYRAGSRVIFTPNRNRELNWFPSIATALYRVWRRNGLRQDDRHYSTTPYHKSLPRDMVDSGNGRIFDYRRDCGSWDLRKHRSLVCSGASGGWW